jgi:hypothetical protein
MVVMSLKVADIAARQAQNIDARNHMHPRSGDDSQDHDHFDRRREVRVEQTEQVAGPYLPECPFAFHDVRSVSPVAVW